MENIALAKSAIESFNLDENLYLELEDNPAASLKFNIKDQGLSNRVLLGGFVNGSIKINFSRASNCKVYIGEEFDGALEIDITGKNSIIYIGRRCNLKNLKISSKQNDDFIAIGNDVTTTNRNHWMSGQGAGNSKPSIIIGDDCMFSYDIVIRNTDAHPIFSFNKGGVVNEPNGIVLIEPHVWIGQQVNILKSVTIGACSIVSLGATVTKDVPRFSIAKGVPAISKVNKDLFWSRGYSKENRGKAVFYSKKYM